MLPSIHTAILKTIGEIANVEVYKSCGKSAKAQFNSLLMVKLGIGRIKMLRKL